MEYRRRSGLVPVERVVQLPDGSLAPAPGWQWCSGCYGDEGECRRCGGTGLEAC